VEINQIKMATLRADIIQGAESSSVTQVPSPAFSVDIEKAPTEANLQNTTVRSFTWQGVSVIVKDRKTKQDKKILDDVDGIVNAGT
jgi:hypothetical protein